MKTRLRRAIKQSLPDKKTCIRRAKLFSFGRMTKRPTRAITSAPNKNRREAPGWWRFASGQGTGLLWDMRYTFGLRPTVYIIVKCLAPRPESTVYNIEALRGWLWSLHARTNNSPRWRALFCTGSSIIMSKDIILWVLSFSYFRIDRQTSDHQCTDRYTGKW